MKSLLPPIALAALLAIIGSSQAAGFVPADQAFSFHLERHGSSYAVVASVRPGFALYADNLTIRSEGTGPIEAALPPAEVIDDPSEGTTRVYVAPFSVPLRFLTPAGRPSAGVIVVRYQGCQIDQFCYPPRTVALDVWG